jgi:hypothetical protein
VKNVASELADNGSSILKLGIILVAMVVVFLYVPSLFHVTPTVDVTNCALSSNTVSNNGVTALSFTLKSNDANNAHVVKVEISSHELVSFSLGSQALQKNENVWTYTETLNPSATHTQSINVKASLENGIAKLDHQIDLTFYIDGQKIQTKSLDLTVKR